MDINEALYKKGEMRFTAMEKAKAKREELHKNIVRVAEIDEKIEALPLRALGGEDIDFLRKDTEELLAERERLLIAAGYDKNYDEPDFECKICSDSGYTRDLKLCKCVRELMAKESYTESTLAMGLRSKTFDNFSLSYYDGEAREKAENNLAVCKKYAVDFPKCGKVAGMIFIGGTGLGKTHLSAAIGNAVSSKGILTVYESAAQIVDIYDQTRFNRIDASEKKKFENCELLIIDDLGTENVTQYSVSVISSLIDVRLVNGKQTVISTNLTPEKIKKIYGDRVFSRLFGEYRVLQFVGGDIRMKRTVG